MNAPPVTPPPLPAPSPEKTLRKLYLTLFLRGRSSRGLQKDKAPKSVGSKLAFVLIMYAFIGTFTSLSFMRQPVFALSLYLHAMTLVFLGMFVAASAGEVLFNKEEGDILMHRPVATRMLLWAKISVLIQISLWLAGAFNLTGFFVGMANADRGWLYPIAHAISVVLEALFCTGCVVMIYQLCLRWFGRERLDGLMTSAQVLVSIVAVVGGQLVPQLMLRLDGKLSLGTDSYWVWLLPPAWFAGFDNALAGSGTLASWVLAGFGLAATALVLWLAFGKLVRNYETGLQNLNEASPMRPRRPGQRRWLDLLIQMPPLRWWLRDSVSRAAFRLTAAYLIRDRDVKLRVYPGLAPLLVMPIIFLLRSHGRGDSPTSGFGIAFGGAYLGLVPMLALGILQYSQQWEAADLFRAAPITGPALLCHGARRAVLCFIALPLLCVLGSVAFLLPGESAHLPLLIPGIIVMPVYALIPNLRGEGVPLSLPTEEAKSAGRGLAVMGVMMVSAMLAGVAVWAWSGGWFGWMLLGETILAAVIYAGMRASLNAVRWQSLE